MIRHSFLGKLDWDGEFFDMLKDNNYVDHEYEYAMKKYVSPGIIYKAKDSGSGENFLSISSNLGSEVRVWTGYSQGKLKKKRRTMYALTDAGAESLLCMLTEEKL